MITIDKLTQSLTLFFASLAISTSASATPTPIYLTNWTQQGNLGNWIVSTDQKSVTQTLNGAPTFFVSPNNFINSLIKGKLKVKPEGNLDNDFIGFVFGYQSPIRNSINTLNHLEFLLFDWKQNSQTVNLNYRAYVGFSLTQINGSKIDNLLHFWQHTDTPEFNVLATDYGLHKGWLDNTEYEFALLYQTNRIKIDIDRKTIFDVSGTFKAGRFGFYNFSQRGADYSNLTYEPVSVPEPNSPLTLLISTIFCLNWKLFHKQ
ncbi:MAG TPA: hypothetical protein DCL61_22015 [Cyanobacteria bacterium UBA12227]|nr:hypothetical protein [Cyanobacteria bacterium UBA12227]HBY79929.1 hypothetical protein [Cyanobacteria bacterium UBA11148]